MKGTSSFGFFVKYSTEFLLGQGVVYHWENTRKRKLIKLSEHYFRIQKEDY